MPQQQTKLWAPSALARLAYRGWMFPPHIQAMEAFFMKLMTDPMMNRAVVQVPVRHGKSVYFSHLLPCWHMMVRPNQNVWVVTYGSDFAAEFGSRNLDVMKEWAPKLTGIRLHPDFARRDHFRMAPPFMGEFRGLGIQGGLAGKGFHLCICDDLIKEFSEVVTEEARDRIYRRFYGEVLNRAEPGAKILVIMSRRHPDDLSGRLLASNAQLPLRDQWHEITFPALSDDGVALWPERYPVEELLSIKRTLELAGESHVWYGLYQQDAAAAAELCEWPATYWKEPFYYSGEPPIKPVLRLMTLDPSKGRDSQVGDFAALLYGIVDGDGTLWIDDPKLLRIPIPELEDTAVAMIAQHKPDAFAIEANGFQESVALSIAAKAPAHTPIYPYVNTRAEALASIRKGTKPGDSVAGKGKEVEIRMTLSPLLSRHDLRIRDTPQGRMLGQQLRDFPQAKYDDGPDALTLMVRLWRDILHGRGQVA